MRILWICSSGLKTPYEQFPYQSAVWSCRTDSLQQVAQKLYEGMGYSTFRTVVNYYNDGSDALDMRKPLKRDKQRKYVRENGREHRVDASQVW